MDAETERKKKRKNADQIQQEQLYHEQANDAQDKSENSEEANKANQSGVIVLSVRIHCLACEERILKYLRGFDGIEVDSKNNRVMVKGKKADPIEVAERMRKKSGKQVNLISPKHPKKEEKKEEEKERVVLKIYLNCQGCAKDVKKDIHKMPVLTVQTDLEKNLATVKGAIEPGKLVEFVKKNTGKHSEIVKKGNQAQKEDKNEKQGDQNCMKDFCKKYPPGLVYAPQLFSDENPNSCSIM